MLKKINKKIGREKIVVLLVVMLSCCHVVSYNFHRLCLRIRIWHLGLKNERTYAQIVRLFSQTSLSLWQRKQSP